MGEIRYLNPPADAMETLEEIAAIEFAVVTDKSPEAVQGLLQVAGVQERGRRAAGAAADAGRGRRPKPVPPSPASNPPKRCASTSNGSTS